MLGLSVDTLVVRCCQLVGAPNVVALNDASRRDWLSGRADMPFRDPPRYAAWQHRDARNGFEVVSYARMARATTWRATPPRSRAMKRGPCIT
jgi:hypothetical protein